MTKKNTDFDRCSKIGMDMIHMLTPIGNGMMDGTVSLRVSKQANVIAGKIIALSRRFTKSNDSDQLDAAEVLLAELKVLVRPIKPVKADTRKRPKKPTTARKVSQSV